MKMYVRDCQRLLTAAGYYNRGIDNDYGPKTYEAVQKILSNHPDKVSFRWSRRRQLIAAAQLILDAAGFEPGVIDGYAGHNTIEAYNAWAYEKEHGKREVIVGRDDDEPDAQQEFDTIPASAWPRQRDTVKFYGNVGTNQARITLPYRMKLAWNTSHRVKTMSCHEKVADAMTGIFQRTLDHYGEAEISRLHLDMFGGCLNVRKMRGGSRYSMHSWGIAVDLDPSNNQLRWKDNRASFARPEYEEFWRIVENAGAISLGRERNFDWMHFQFARL